MTEGRVGQLGSSDRLVFCCFFLGIGIGELGEGGGGRRAAIYLVCFAGVGVLRCGERRDTVFSQSAQWGVMPKASGGRGGGERTV